MTEEKDIYAEAAALWGVTRAEAKVRMFRSLYGGGEEPLTARMGVKAPNVQATPKDPYMAYAEAHGITRAEAKEEMLRAQYSEGRGPFNTAPLSAEPLDRDKTPQVSIVGVTKKEADSVISRLRRAGLLAFHRQANRSLNLFVTKAGAKACREMLIRALTEVRDAQMKRVYAKMRQDDKAQEQRATEERLRQNEDSRGEY